MQKLELLNYFNKIIENDNYPTSKCKFNKTVQILETDQYIFAISTIIYYISIPDNNHTNNIATGGDTRGINHGITKGVIDGVIEGVTEEVTEDVNVSGIIEEDVHVNMYDVHEHNNKIIHKSIVLMRYTKVGDIDETLRSHIETDLTICSAIWITKIIDNTQEFMLTYFNNYQSLSNNTRKDTLDLLAYRFIFTQFIKSIEEYVSIEIREHIHNRIYIISLSDNVYIIYNNADPIKYTKDDGGFELALVNLVEFYNMNVREEIMVVKNTCDDKYETIFPKNNLLYLEFTNEYIDYAALLKKYFFIE